MGAGVHYTTLDYRYFLGATPSVAVQGLNRETLRSESASVGFPLSRGMRLGVYVERWRRVSVGLPYETIRAGIEFATGRIKINERGVFVNGLGR